MDDLKKLTEGTVDNAKSQLAGLNDSELRELREADDRKTLREAIDSELASREASDEGEDRPTGSDGTPVKQAGDSVNRDSAQNVDEGRKARLETMSKATDDL